VRSGRKREADVQDGVTDREELATADERGLVLAARRGDLDAYAELVRRHQHAAVRAARAMGAGDWAEDAAQEGFVSAWHALDRFAEDRRFRPWLVAIVVNEVRNRQRLWRRREVIVQRVGARLGPQEPPPSDEVAEQIERRHRLTEALSRLPEKQRLVVTFRYLMELTEDETASALGWPRGSVKSRLSRALEKLHADPAVRALLRGEEEA
jgi:RNA polymerase sigma-70 factor (ECF subfamily)